MDISWETEPRRGPTARDGRRLGALIIAASRRLPRRLTAVLVLPLLTSVACGGFCRGYTDNSLQGAEFSAEEPGVTLSIDREAGVLTLVEGDRTIERAFTVVPESDRPMRCPTQAGATRVEVLELGEEPLELAGKRFDRPVLEAACGKRREAILIDRDADGAVKAELVFEPGQ